MVKFNPAGSSGRVATRSRREAAADRAREQEMAAEFGELEFRASIDPAMDPVAALGYEPGKARAVFKPLFDTQGGLSGFYQRPSGRNEAGDSLPFYDTIQAQTDQDLRFDDVVVADKAIAGPDIWAHEFRHRGLEQIRTRIKQEDFAEMYGEDAASFLYNEDEEGYVSMETEPVEGVARLTGDMTLGRRAALREALTDAALGLLEEDLKTPPEERGQPEDRSSALDFLRSMLGRKSK